METTLNVHVDILKQITAAAKKSGISRSKMITILIKRVMDDIPNPGRMGSLVRYQKRRRHDQWIPVHLYLRIDDYEYFQDLRKLRKMSISLILAYAVKNFLIKLLESKNMDNYRYRNYIIIREIIDNIISWRIFWGFPPTIGHCL